MRKVFHMKLFQFEHYVGAYRHKKSTKHQIDPDKTDHGYQFWQKELYRYIQSLLWVIDWSSIFVVIFEQICG